MQDEVRTKLKLHFNAIIALVQENLPSDSTQRLNALKGEFFTKTAEYQKFVETLFSDPTIPREPKHAMSQTAIGNFNEQIIIKP